MRRNCTMLNIIMQSNRLPKHVRYFISVSDIESIIAVLENYVNYRPQFLIELAPLLEGNSVDAASLAKLNYALRKTRYRHFASSFDQMEVYIPAFETWIRKTDTHEIPFSMVIFDYRKCPDDRLLSRDDDYYKRQQEMFSIRQDAFEKIFRKFGVEGVKTLISQMDDNADWGNFLLQIDCRKLITQNLQTCCFR